MKVKKKRTYNIRLIRSRRSYTIAEIASLFRIYVGTVRRWHKQGLEPIDPDDHPILFIGETIREFLKEKQESRKFPLKEDEFFCPRCRQPRKSIQADIVVIITVRKIGKSDFHAQIKGRCTDCGCGLNRFATKNGLKDSFWSEFITQEETRL